MADEKVELIYPPVVLNIDNAEVHVLEVVRQEPEIGGQKLTFIIASAFVVWRCLRSPLFHVFAESEDQLMAKLRAEVAKMKLLYFSGHADLFQKVC